MSSHTPLPVLLLVVGLSTLLIGCGDKDDDSGASESVTDACQLAEDHSDCPACADGDVTCSYGEHSVTRMSCGDCQARSQLYQELCDAGVNDAEADILAGLECSDPVPGEDAG